MTSFLVAGRCKRVLKLFWLFELSVKALEVAIISETSQLLLRGLIQDSLKVLYQLGDQSGVVPLPADPSSAPSRLCTVPCHGSGPCCLFEYFPKSFYKTWDEANGPDQYS